MQLLTEQAFIFGQEKEIYCDIATATCAIMFMATPHGGSKLALILQKITKALGIVIPHKAYVDELIPSSETLNCMSTRFRDCAEGLDVYSLYETIRTRIAPFWKV